ncbi:unnamed protein product [Discula destructiva]
MKSLLATETPADEDSDLELLFQEDADDVGFTDNEDDDGSDAAMESSDDEDKEEAQDDDAGEKELERQAKEKRAAARKRKAQEAIPAKFRKKVRIHPPDASSASTAAAPPPRPKKKSERASWLPTEAEMPTRASGRKTTQLSKEQLHQQMIEREARRLKQVELMERQAKKNEAMKKPPMTQAEKLREAAVVEKRNAKSLNRWEEAEKQREEERHAKLAALNNRRLEGPVVTFWTGIIDLSEVQLKHVGKLVSMEEKPKRKRPSTAVSKDVASAAGPNSESDPSGTAQAMPTTQDAPGLPSKPEIRPDTETPKIESTPETPMDSTTSALLSSELAPPAPMSPANASSVPAPDVSGQPPFPLQPTPSPTFRPLSPALTSSANMSTLSTSPPHIFTPAPSAVVAPPNPSPTVKTEPQSSKPMPLALRPDIGPRFMPPPNPHFARPAHPSPQAPLAPQATIANGPTGGQAAIPVPRSTSLDAPASNAIPLQSPLGSSNVQASVSIPPPNSTALPSPHQPSAPQLSPVHTTASFQPIFPEVSSAKAAKKQQIDQGASKKSTGKASAARKPPPPPPPEPPVPEPPMEGKVTRACIILQDFDEDAIKKPDVQTQILFGWKMNRLAKPPHPPLCVITNQPARYRDPKTGLPYYNAYAFKEIQKLLKGNFKWSKLLGTWVGNGSDAAKGVPDRFTRPETETERKDRLERKEQAKKFGEEQTKAAEATEAATASGLEAEGPRPVPGAEVAPAPAFIQAPAPAFAAPNIPPPAPVDVPSITPSPNDGKPAGPGPAPVASMSGQSGQSS